MIAALDTNVVSRLLRPMVGNLSREVLQGLASFQADETDSERYVLLAESNNQGTLTAGEQVELETLVQAHSVLSALKTEARYALLQTRSA